MGSSVMASSQDQKLIRWGVEEMRVQQMGSSRDIKLSRWGVEEKRSSEDEEFRKCRVHEMGSLGDGEFRRSGF